MEPAVAIRLIEKGVRPKGAAHWADLGAGDGLFTKVLSTLLPPGSEIYAIDKNPVVKSIVVQGDITLHSITKDFTDTSLVAIPLDGIMIANALHYVRDKVQFVQQWKKKLKADGVLIIVEYDIDTGNQWIPYPLSFNRLIRMKKELGASDIMQIGKEASAYHRQGMYSALMKF